MDLKRRDFLAASVSAVATAAVSSSVDAQPVSDPDSRYVIGEFILIRAGSDLRVTHERSPDWILWASERCLWQARAEPDPNEREFR